MAAALHIQSHQAHRQKKATPCTACRKNRHGACFSIYCACRICRELQS